MRFSSRRLNGEEGKNVMLQENAFYRYRVVNQRTAHGNRNVVGI